MLSHAISYTRAYKISIINTTEYTYITLQALHLQYNSSVTKIFVSCMIQ